MSLCRPKQVESLIDSCHELSDQIDELEYQLADFEDERNVAQLEVERLTRILNRGRIMSYIAGLFTGVVFTVILFAVVEWWANL